MGLQDTAAVRLLLLVVEWLANAASEHTFNIADIAHQSMLRLQRKATWAGHEVVRRFDSHAVVTTIAYLTSAYVVALLLITLMTFAYVQTILLYGALRKLFARIKFLYIVIFPVVAAWWLLTAWPRAIHTYAIKRLYTAEAKTPPPNSYQEALSTSSVIPRKEMAARIPAMKAGKEPAYVVNIVSPDGHRLGFASAMMRKGRLVLVTATHVVAAALQFDHGLYFEKDGKSTTAPTKPTIRWQTAGNSGFDDYDLTAIDCPTAVSSGLGVRAGKPARYKQNAILTVLSTSKDAETLKATGKVTLVAPYRVSYQMSTSPGSSGSPLFDGDGIHGIHTGCNGKVSEPLNFGSLLPDDFFFAEPRLESTWNSQGRPYEEPDEGVLSPDNETIGGSRSAALMMEYRELAEGGDYYNTYTRYVQGKALGKRTNKSRANNYTLGSYGGVDDDPGVKPQKEGTKGPQKRVHFAREVSEPAASPTEPNLGNSRVSNGPETQNGRSSGVTTKLDENSYAEMRQLTGEERSPRVSAGKEPSSALAEKSSKGKPRKRTETLVKKSPDSEAGPSQTEVQKPSGDPLPTKREGKSRRNRPRRKSAQAPTEEH